MNAAVSFSIIIPLFNKEKSVAHTIQSILNQSYNHFELIIVDDGSTDDSLAIINSFRDSRIRIFKQNNQGPSGARNTGIAQSSFAWLLFIDADDTLTPDALKYLAEKVNSYPNIDLFIGAYKNDDQLIRRYNKTKLIRNGHRAFVLDWLFLLTGTFICRKSLVENIRYDPRLWKLEDVDFMLRVERSLLHKKRILYFPFVLALRSSAFAEASKVSRPISKDFRGYLDLSSKPFWERIANYNLFISCQTDYPEDSKVLYPEWGKKRLIKTIWVIINYYRLIRFKVRRWNRLFLFKHE